jgi:hypothetical protein
MASTANASDRETLVSRLINRAHSLQEDEHEKAVALVRDTRVVIRKLFGETSPYLPELDSILFRPVGGIYNTGHYMNTGVWNAGVKQLDHILKSMLLECRLPTSSDLNPPEKVTIRWLLEHVPWQTWIWLAGAMLAIFTLGVTMGQTTFIKQLFYKAPALPQRELPTSQNHTVTNTSTEELPGKPPAMPQRDLPNSQIQTATNASGVLIPPTWITAKSGVPSPDGVVYLGVDSILLDGSGIPWLVNAFLTAEAPDLHEVRWDGSFLLAATRRQLVGLAGKRYSLSILQCESNRVEMSVHTLP